MFYWFYPVVRCFFLYIFVLLRMTLGHRAEIFILICFQLSWEIPYCSSCFWCFSTFSIFKLSRQKECKTNKNKFLKEFWQIPQYIISPGNPHKKKTSNLTEYSRCGKLPLYKIHPPPALNKKNTYRLFPRNWWGGHFIPKDIFTGLSNYDEKMNISKFWIGRLWGEKRRWHGG